MGAFPWAFSWAFSLVGSPRPISRAPWPEKHYLGHTGPPSTGSGTCRGAIPASCGGPPPLVLLILLLYWWCHHGHSSLFGLLCKPPLQRIPHCAGHLGTTESLIHHQWGVHLLCTPQAPDPPHTNAPPWHPQLGHSQVALPF